MAFGSKVGSLLKQSGGMSSAKLYVGGLAYATDEMGLRQAFQEFGEVIEAKVVTDRDSGRSRGFGFVSYTSADAANTALQDMDGKELHGRTIRVSFAQERPRPSFGGGGGDGYGGAGGYSGVVGIVNHDSTGNNGSLNHDLAEKDGRHDFEDLFGKGLGGASGVSPGGGNEGDVVGISNHDLAEKDGRYDFEDLFGKGLGGASGVSPGGGNEEDIGILNHDLTEKDGRYDFEDPFGKGLGGASWVSRGGGGDEDDVVGDLNRDSAGTDGRLKHDLTDNDGKYDSRDDDFDYAKANDNCVCM